MQWSVKFFNELAGHLVACCGLGRPEDELARAPDDAAKLVGSSTRLAGCHIAAKVSSHARDSEISPRSDIVDDGTGRAEVLRWRQWTVVAVVTSAGVRIE
ncbi:hypothetical protein CRG98_032819 [Punica granatum]|uniref:Uncharacterized protein n=1 Tax=Punica granatum TaxID=22663 RepID=A0A2I0IS13_PUNGR|nr:hypothetical protein CRG98_032819 [Punica granatum]